MGSSYDIAAKQIKPELGSAVPVVAVENLQKSFGSPESS